MKVKPFSKFITTTSEFKVFIIECLKLGYDEKAIIDTFFIKSSDTFNVNPTSGYWYNLLHEICERWYGQISLKDNS